MTSGETASGLYGPTEAARIIDIRTKKLRRWLEGERAMRGGEPTYAFRPVLQAERSDAHLRLSFMQFVEVLFVKGFLDEGVPMKVVRAVHNEAEAELGSPYPFTLKRFEHDGRTIIERAKLNGREHLIDRYRAQHLMRAIMLPLVRKLDYDKLSDQAQRYFPLGKDRPVVLDPTHAFGEAVAARSSVPTRVLYGMRRAGESVERIANWYEIDSDEVVAAIEYEELLELRRAA